MGEARYYCKKYTLNATTPDGTKVCYGHDVKDFQKKRGQRDWDLFLKQRNDFKHAYTNDHKQKFLKTGSIYGRSRKCVSRRIDGVYYTGIMKKHCNEISFNNKEKTKELTKNSVKLLKGTNLNNKSENKSEIIGNINNNKYFLLSDKDIIDIIETLDAPKFEFLERMYWDKWSDRYKNRYEKQIQEAVKKNDVNKFAWYYNTHSSTYKGKCSHWTCAFFVYNQDDKSYKYEYFDSFGAKPPIYISRNLNIFGSIFKKIFDLENVAFNYNNKKYQYDATECGVWIIWFIHNMLLNRNLNTNIINKNKMRNRYVRQSCKKEIKLRDFHRVDVKGDGHCAYRVILLFEDYLKNPNVSINDLKLMDTNRRINSNNIHSLRKSISDMGIKGKNNENIECERKNKCKLCEWASFETISLYCQQKGYKLCIYREKSEDIAIREPGGIVSNGGNYEHVLFILYNGIHFQLLIPR